MGAGVLFRGEDQVIEAYEAMDVPAWSMWLGTSQLLFSYPKKAETPNISDGANALREAFHMLQRGGTASQLLLKVYEELPQGKIKSNTPYDNSFGFSLFGFEEENPIGQARTQGYKNLEARIDNLTKLISTEREESEEKPGGIMGVIGTILEEPGMKQFIIGEVVSAVRNLFNKHPQPPIATMAGVETQQQGSKWETLPADQQEKLKQAMEMLMGVDPKIGDHLMGLANMAVNQPSKYQMALKFL
jgi:hypothetical protein